MDKLPLEILQLIITDPVDAHAVSKAYNDKIPELKLILKELITQYTMRGLLLKTLDGVFCFIRIELLIIF